MMGHTGSSTHISSAHPMTEARRTGREREVGIEQRLFEARRAQLVPCSALEVYRDLATRQSIASKPGSCSRTDARGVPGEEEDEPRAVAEALDAQRGGHARLDDCRGDVDVRQGWW